MTRSRMVKQLGLIGLAVVVVGTLLFSGTGSSSEPEARAQRLASEIRCPVCDGLAVADSPSSTARAIATDIRRRVDSGESDAEVRSAYVERYGKWILLEPPARGVGALLWFLPVAVVAGAIGMGGWVILRRAGGTVLSPTEAEVARVQRAREPEARPGGMT